MIMGTGTATIITTAPITTTSTKTDRRRAMFDYLRDPDAIYRQSFAMLRDACDFSHVPESLVPMAERVVHACGQPDIVPNLAWGGDAPAAGHAAIRAGRPIYVDAEMVGAGIMKARLPAGNEVRCTLNDPATPTLAKERSTTRSAAAVELWLDDLKGAVAVFGNAPTALFRLLELLAEGAPKPALILGFPVGFVGAAESKDALIERAGDVPFVTLRGRLGGSAMAAAAVNALLLETPK
jgi:precorrin-8X/cobalt-precorrin-8 methylmutase